MAIYGNTYSAWTSDQYYTTSATSNSIYGGWVSQPDYTSYGTVSTTYDSTADATVWQYWNNQTGIRAQQYVPQYVDAQVYGQIWYRWNQEIQQYERTAMEHQALEAQRRAIDVQQQMRQLGSMPLRQEQFVDPKAEELRKKKIEVEATAVDLLMDLIGEEQREAYRQTGKLIVKGAKHTWMLTREGRVRRLVKGTDGKVRLQSYCVAALDRYKYPDTDNVIALLLAIASSESDVLKTANKTGVRELTHEGFDPKTLLPKDAHAVADLRLAA